MKRSRSPRDLWASLLPILGAAVALAAAYRFRALGSGGPPMPAWLLVTLVLAGAAMACHRPAAGINSLGLATMVLPAAFRLSGAAPAAALAAAVFLVSEMALRIVRRVGSFQPPERRNFFPRALEVTGRSALAVLGAGCVWAWLAGRWHPAALVALTAGVYFLVWI